MKNDIRRLNLYFFSMDKVNNIISNNSREIFECAYPPDFMIGTGAMNGDYIIHKHVIFYVEDSKWEDNPEWYMLKVRYLGQFKDGANKDDVTYEDLEDYRKNVLKL